MVFLSLAPQSLPPSSSELLFHSTNSFYLEDLNDRGFVSFKVLFFPLDVAKAKL